jgi:hypothetical protein
MKIELSECPYQPHHHMTCGVYRLQIGECFYIGSGARIGSRFSTHINELKAGTHRSAKLQAAWDKHRSAEKIIVQEVIPKAWDKTDDGTERAKLLEDQEIKRRFNEPGCCNLSSSAYYNTRIGETMRSKWQDPEFRAMMREKLAPSWSAPRSAETRAKMSLAKTGANNPKSRSITIIQNGEILKFPTSRELADHLGISQQAAYAMTKSKAWPRLYKPNPSPRAKVRFTIGWFNDDTRDRKQWLFEALADMNHGDPRWKLPAGYTGASIYALRDSKEWPL